VMDMWDAPTVPEAERRRQLIVTRYQQDFPAACRCLLDDAEASINHLYVSQRHQRVLPVALLDLRYGEAVAGQGCIASVESAAWLSPTS
jgi:hypothetical protein